MLGRDCLPILFVLMAATSGADVIKRTQDPRISPDGQTIAFAWQDDIWVVPATGGQARRLTVNPAIEAWPVWSPDGKQIIFQSTRFGSGDIFVMDSDGSHVKRITFDSGVEVPMAVSPDGRFVFGYGSAWGHSEVFRVPIEGGDLVRLTSHNMESSYYPAVSADGKTVFFCLGGSAAHWRKVGWHGSNTSEIWSADSAAPLAKFKRVTNNDAWDLFPTPTSDGGLVVVSNRNGSANLWKLSANGKDAKQLTHFTAGTIRMPSVSKDGKKIVFQKDSQIWLQEAGGEPKPVAIEAPGDTVRNPIQVLNQTTGIGGYAISPDGKKVAVVIRGDIYAATDKGGMAKRLTTNPGLDGSPVWLDDKTVLYVSARENAKRELRTVTIEGEDKLFKAEDKDLTNPTLSPDRKWLAFHRGNRQIAVMPVGGGDAKTIEEGPFGGALLGEASFVWAPDSESLLVTEGLERGDQAMLVSRDGSKKTRVARSGKSMSVARFLGSKSVFFSATQGSNYSETRDSESPLYAVELAPAKIEFREDDLLGKKPKEEASTKVVVVERGLEDRTKALTTVSVSDVAATADGKTLVGMVDKQFSSINPKTGAATPIATIVGKVDNPTFGPDGKLYGIQAGKLVVGDIKAGILAPIALTAQAEIDVAQEEKALFEEIWWTYDRLFYDPKLHGKDWPGVRREFEGYLPYVTSRQDFYALMGEMVERLDSSHIGANGPPATRPESGDSTASLGVEWDPAALALNGSFVVRKVYENSPAAHPDMELQVGDRLLDIDGVKPSSAKPLAALLNGKSGKKVRLAIERNNKTIAIDFKPEGPEARNAENYKDWVLSNRKLVDKLSGGKLAYLHIQAMGAPALDTFLREIQTETVGKKGVVIDVRFNGGGYTSHIILNILRKVPWLIRTNRDNPGLLQSENNYRGNALELPTVCVINGHSFSNAEIFAEGYRRLQLGKIIGEPTAGGVIGTSQRALWDGGSIGLPGSGAYAIDGENLEGHGRKPDILVETDPNWFAGEDPQLATAVKTLLGQLGK